MMKILFYEWGSYIAKDICLYFDENKIQYKLLCYHLEDKNDDDIFEKRMLEELAEGDFDIVFSVNYFPLVAKCCYQNSIKYASWSYDNPLNVVNIEKTLWYETNYVFLFDRLQVEQYKDKGFKNIFHLPLAVNAKRLSKVLLTSEDISRYSSDISFVGNLYSSMLSVYTKPMNEYQKGYIDGVCNAQGRIYGYYMIDLMLTDSFMESIQNQYKNVNPDTRFVLPREALAYAMSAEVTRRERLSILGVLSNHFDVQLYSNESLKDFANVKYQGTCDYFSEMPKVFKMSKINLNITLKILQSGIPLRVLDIMGSGGFVLSNYQPELAESFEDGKEVVMYDSLEDAYSKAAFYLRNDDARNSVVENAMKKITSCYNYSNRFEYIFRTVLGT